MEMGDQDIPLRTTLNNKAVIKSSSTSGLTINLHPLAILNISDHANRARLVKADPRLIPIGALLGWQSGRDISVANSFELLVSPADEGLFLDREFFQTRRDQFSQVFPTLTVVGWYAVEQIPTEADLLLHKQFSDAIESTGSPIFVLFNPSILGGAQNLPFKAYESALVEGNNRDDSNGQFVELEYGIETGEAERIAVDEVSKGTGGDGDETGYISTLSTQRNAMRMLLQKVQILSHYINSVLSGMAEPDHSLLRQIHGLVASLPIMDASELKSELLAESDDVQLTTYLTSLMKTLNSLSEYADKHAVLYSQNATDEQISGPTRGKGSMKGGQKGGRLM